MKVVVVALLVAVAFANGKPASVITATNTLYKITLGDSNLPFGQQKHVLEEFAAISDYPNNDDDRNARNLAQAIKFKQNHCTWNVVAGASGKYIADELRGFVVLHVPPLEVRAALPTLRRHSSENLENPENVASKESPESIASKESPESNESPESIASKESPESKESPDSIASKESPESNESSTIIQSVESNESLSKNSKESPESNSVSKNSLVADKVFYLYSMFCKSTKCL